MHLSLDKIDSSVSVCLGW